MKHSIVRALIAVLALLPGLSCAQLTPGFNLPVGSNIGQLTQVLHGATNALKNAAAPVVGGSGSWALAGTAAMGGSSGNFDNGSQAQLIQSVNGLADYVSNASIAGSGTTTYAVQGTFSVDASYGLANPSPSVRMGVNWTGGVARFDYVDFNTGSGVITASANVVSAVATVFSSDTGVAGGPIKLVRITFVTASTPLSTSAGEFRVYPSSAQTVGDVIGGSFQVEVGTSSTSYIPTPLGGTFQRYPGVTPRQASDNYIIKERVLSAGTRDYQPGVDRNALLYIETNGVTVNLTGTNFGVNAGDYVYVFVDPSVTSATVSASGGCVQGGPNATCAASITLTPSGLSGGLFVATNPSTRVWTLLGVSTSAPIKVASGTSALGTGAISSGTCATVVTTTATGALTTDVVDWGFNGDPTGVTGYAPSVNGMLTIMAYPSAGNVNYKVCNNTSASVTPGSITLNWAVRR